MTDDLEARRKALRARCRWLSGHGPETPAELLSKTAAWCEANDVEFDAYGSGALIEGFEAKIAERLGMPAARFLPSGTMAQQIAMRVWCERAGRRHFGMHPTSHLELHEQRGYAQLHGLSATLVGPADRPLLAEHFGAVAEPLAALLVELPIREAGGQLPTWDELEALRAATAAKGTRLHLDGARLWESAAGLGHDYAAICGLFDSVYVSFYKGIGALPGAMLLGPRGFIDEAIVWQRRHGGNLFRLAPNVASAALRFDERLARMPAYLERARTLARTLDAIEGVAVLPSPPHVNMMHVFLRGETAAILEARDRVAESTGLWLLQAVQPAAVPGHVRFELYVGEAAMPIDDAAVDAGFRALVGAG